MKKNENAREDLGNLNSNAEFLRRLLTTSLERIRNLPTNHSSRGTEVSSLATPFVTQQYRVSPIPPFMPRTHFGPSSSDSLAAVERSPLGASEGEASRSFLVPHEASRGGHCRTDDNQSSHRQPFDSQKNFACSNREQVPQDILKTTCIKKGTEQSELFPGRTRSHLDLKPLLQMPIERDGYKPTSQKAKGRGEIERVSAVVTQADDSSNIEMAANNASLGCSAGAESVSVAGPSRSQNQSRTTEKKKMFSCNVCGRDFGQISQLISHSTVHIGEKRFECLECGKRFTNGRNLKTHLLIHTGQRPFACDICGKAFTTKAILQNHRRVHTGEKPFECEFCGKTFSLRSSLANHRRIHTGEKPYSCHICSKAFIQKATLNAHLRTHKVQNTG